ncbi:hypothetical protein L9F63_013938, partial [Diploptera punctata]
YYYLISLPNPLMESLTFTFYLGNLTVHYRRNSMLSCLQLTCYMWTVKPSHNVETNKAKSGNVYYCSRIILDHKHGAKYAIVKSWRSGCNLCWLRIWTFTHLMLRREICTGCA